MIDIAALCEIGIGEWRNTKACASLQPWYITAKQRMAYEAQIDTLFQDLQRFLAAFPKQKQANMRWRQKGVSYIEELMKGHKVPLLEGMNDEVQALFQMITVSFLKDVRAFDRELSFTDAMQALRNVWIIAILQCLFQKPQGYHKAMFAYSMLYPYSDNYLDDETVSLAEKQHFNEWFTARLHGEALIVHNTHEEKISALVGMIEQRFPRAQYPQVYESLYLIQAAQIQSLRQQDGKKQLSDEALLAISYEKGGTSVVADGMLIEGNLNEEQLRFCMRYGFMLQIGDDLQDGRVDASHHHQTLIANHINEIQDEIVSKLMRYTIDILTPASLCADRQLSEFVLRDCLYLIFFALIKQDAPSISAVLNEQLLHCLPVSLSFIESRKAKQPYRYTQAQWWERIDALLETNLS